MLGHVHALVNLHVRAYADTVSLGCIRHVLDIELKHVNVDHHAGGGQNVLGHSAEILARDALIEFCERKLRASGFRSPYSRNRGTANSAGSGHEEISA